jgi:hypothetical protein
MGIWDFGMGIWDFGMLQRKLEYSQIPNLVVTLKKAFAYKGNPLKKVLTTL